MDHCFEIENRARNYLFIHLVNIALKTSHIGICLIFTQSVVFSNELRFERLRLAKVVKPTYRLHIDARVNAALLNNILDMIIVSDGSSIATDISVLPMVGV